MILSWIKVSHGGAILPIAQNIAIDLVKERAHELGNRSGWRIHGAVRGGVGRVISISGCFYEQQDFIGLVVIYRIVSVCSRDTY